MDAVLRMFLNILVILIGLSPTIGLCAMFYTNPDLVGIGDDKLEMGFIVYFIVQVILLFAMSTAAKYIWKDKNNPDSEVYG